MTAQLTDTIRTGVLAGCVVLLPALTGAQTVDDLFNSATLHRVDLLVNSRDWEKLKANFQENEYYPADIRWNGLTARNVGIRSRGGGSRSGTKPGLRVDFDRYATDQTFVGLKSFILDNLTQDPTGLRERVAMRFFERLGLPAPREAHVQLYVNADFAGLYAVVESIDKDFLRRVFGGNSGNVENDGYLFEYEYTSAWYFTYPGNELDPYSTLFDPVTHENGSIAELYAPLESMLRAINEASDDRFVSTVSPYLDLPLFMKHVAVQNFLAQWDGILGYAGVNNFYFYRFEDSLRSQFIAWDEDNAFHALDYPILEGHDQNVLMRLAMRVPELRAAYFEALLAAAESAAEPVAPSGLGWLDLEIQQHGGLIAETMLADPVKPFTNEEFESGMNELRTFARSRASFVKCEVAKLVDPATMAAACGNP